MSGVIRPTPLSSIITPLSWDVLFAKEEDADKGMFAISVLSSVFGIGA